MKYTVAFLFVLVAFSQAAPPRRPVEDDGSYHPSDEGQYVPDNNPGRGRAGPAPNRRVVPGGTGGQFGLAPIPQGPRNSPYTPISVEGPESRASILRSESDIGIDGYRWLYETDNGIFAQEEGHLQNQGTENEALRAVGDFRYTAPEGDAVAISYVADENGYQPAGAILPTPPPTPEAIAKALDFLQATGQL